MKITPTYKEVMGVTWLSLKAKGHIDMNLSDSVAIEVTFFVVSPTELKDLIDSLTEQYAQFIHEGGGKMRT